MAMMNWMLDTSADVTLSQPTSFTYGGVYNYGGANVLVKTLEAVELLCARCANASCTWTPVQYDQVVNLSAD